MTDSHTGPTAHTVLRRLFPLLAALLLAPALLHASTVNVVAGGDLQAALDAAQPGDTIVLPAGATFEGSFVLRYKAGTGTDADWITIRTSTPDSSLPPDRRVFPADAAKLARIVSPGNAEPALQTEPGAHHYKLIGLEIAPRDAQAFLYDVVVLGVLGPSQDTLAEVPGHLVIDRCWIHAYDGQSLKRGIQLNSASTDILNSYIAGFKVVGQDAQAIGAFNGPGPYRIINNYLEGSGENVIFGGADPSIPNLVPSDIDIEGNHFYKPVSWYFNDPSYAGTHWSVKNLLELKNAQRVVIDGNLFEDCWGDAQVGYAVLLTPRNQEGTAPWSAVRDVRFTHNIVRHSGAGVQILGTDDAYTSQPLERVTIADNVFEDIDSAKWNGTGWLFLIVSGFIDLTIDHTTGFQTDNLITFDGAPGTGFVFTNNIAPHNLYGVKGSDHASGTDSLDAFCPGYVFRRNVIPGSPAGAYPTDNFYPASLNDVGFVDQAGGDYHLAAGSPYKSQGTDGRDPGADIDAVQAATAGAVSGAGSPGGGTGQTPFLGSAFTVPGTIYASDFDNGGEGVAYHDTTPGNDSSSTYRTSDVDMYNQAVLGLDAGEWLEYTVDVGTPGTYALVAQVSAVGAGGAFHVEVDGVDVTGSLAVPVTGSWSTWGSAVKTGIGLTAGRHVLRFAVDSSFDGFYSLRIVDPAAAQSPYGGTARALPGTISAADFDEGGELVSYHDVTAGCDGSCSGRTSDVDRWEPIVYNLSAGEWLEYTVDVTAGTYSLQVRVASGPGGTTFHVEFDGVDVTGPMTIPATGAWNTFQTLMRSGVTLTAGRKVMRIVVDRVNGSGADTGSFDTVTLGP